MLRMSVLTLAAAAALGTAALTPTIAAADWNGWRHRDAIEDRLERRDRIEDRFEHRFFRRPFAAVGDGGCVSVRRVPTLGAGRGGASGCRLSVVPARCATSPRAPRPTDV
jgi:hypothetical protein